MGLLDRLPKVGLAMSGHWDLKCGVVCVLRDHQAGAKSLHLDSLKSWGG